MKDLVDGGPFALFFGEHSFRFGSGFLGQMRIEFPFGGFVLGDLAVVGDDVLVIDSHWCLMMVYDVVKIESYLASLPSFN